MRIASKMVDAYRASGLCISAHLDLTYRCPLQCVHCYLHGQRNLEEMNTQQVLGVMEQLRDLGVLYLTMSGGEVLLRPDFVPLLRQATEMRFAVDVKTSGWQASTAALVGIADASPLQVSISFYSDRPAEHDGVTRRTGSFDHALRTALFLQEEGVRVVAVFTPLAGHCEEPARVQAGLESSGIQLVSFNTLTDTRCDCQDVSDLWVGQDSLERLFDQAVRSSLEDYPKRPLDSAPCPIGVGDLYVGPDANVYPCLRLPILLGNALEQKVAEIWRDSEFLQKMRTVRWGTMERCSTCADQRFCPHCFGINYHDTKDPLVPSEEMCAQARAIRNVLLRRKADKGDK
jgi:radical SAM protein with 4Fe4S-binding SPASM domain